MNRPAPRPEKAPPAVSADHRQRLVEALARLIAADLEKYPQLPSAARNDGAA